MPARAAASTLAPQPYVVYQLLCVDTGRVYVGFTSDVRRRYAEHKRSPPPRMREDAASYSPFEEHFALTVLEQGIPTATQAKRRETHYIKALRARTGAGYNEAPGSTTRAFWWRMRHGALSVSAGQ